MPTNQFQAKDQGKNIALAGMVTPDVITDLFRANGAVLLLSKLGIIDETLVEKFEGCFDELRTSLIGVKGIVQR